MEVPDADNYATFKEQLFMVEEGTKIIKADSKETIA
jgi:hypothetical protein